MFVDQAAQDGFSEDPSAVEAGNGQASTVVVAVGDALGGALVRPGRVGVHLVVSQDGAQVAFPQDEHAVPEFTAQGSGEALTDRVHRRSLGGRAHDPGASSLEEGIEGGSEVRSAIAHQEPDVLKPLAEGASEV